MRIVPPIALAISKSQTFEDFELELFQAYFVFRGSVEGGYYWRFAPSIEQCSDLPKLWVKWFLKINRRFRANAYSEQDDGDEYCYVKTSWSGQGWQWRPTLRKRVSRSCTLMLCFLTWSREARLVDDDMDDVTVGKEGEMLVKGPTVFQ